MAAQDPSESIVTALGEQNMQVPAMKVQEPANEENKV
jgi:hypothetical protein